MKFLIDNNLSPLLADALKAAGHDAIHVRDIGLQAAPDEAVLGRASVGEQVLISADTDFGGLLSRSKANRPQALDEGVRRGGNDARAPAERAWPTAARRLEWRAGAAAACRRPARRGGASGRGGGAVRARAPLRH